MRRSSLALILVASLVSVFFFSVTGYAQGNLGAVTGTVQDASGAVVPDAAITITNVSTGVKWTGRTSSAGYYRVPVPPGTYKVQTEKAGFKAAVASHIDVPVAQVVTIDLKLTPGNVVETIEVTSQAPLLETSSSEVGSAVTPEEFGTLPVLVDDGGRDLQAIIFASLPGTVGNSWNGSINGGQLFSHDILIDGVSIARYDLSGGSLTEFQPPTDSIGEFKVQSSNYSAEYGDTGGGVANFTYKSGTNAFHGSAFEYLKNPVFNAAGALTDAYPPPPGEVAQFPKDNVKENNWGFTIGGPIHKDRTFFFVSYEGDRYRDFSFASLATIPTTPMTTGNFNGSLGSQVGTDALGRPVYKYEIYDPLTTRNVTAGQVDPVTGLTANANTIIRDPFGDPMGTNLSQLNIIPNGEISTASASLLPMFPAPLLSGFVRDTLAFSGCCPHLNRDAYTVKIDHVLTSKQKIWGSYTHNWRHRYIRAATTFPPFDGNPLSPYKQQETGGPQIRIAHAWTISDRSLNEFQIGYNRFYNNNGLSQDAKYFPTSLVGVPQAGHCFPNIALTGGYIPGVPKALGHSCATFDPMDSIILQDSFNYLRGKHSLKFGGQFLRYRYTSNDSGSVSGTYAFTTTETGLPDFSTATGNPYASFVLGAANHASGDIYATEPGYFSGIYSLYAQDDFKVTPKLTLNLGLRWEIPMPQTERKDQESGFNPTLPNPGADNILGAYEFLGNCATCNHRHSFEDWYFKELGPRFGLAYGITNKLVFRGGYGISYSPPIENNWGAVNITGFNDSVSVAKGSAIHTTGFKVDPALYWSPLTSASTGAARVGLPTYTGTLPNRTSTVANYGNYVDFLPRNGAAQPYTQNWSAGFQYMAPHDILLQADYMGSKGSRLVNYYFASLYNQPAAKYMGLGDLLWDDLATDLADPVNGPILAQYGITGAPYNLTDFENNNWSTSINAAIQPYPQYGPIYDNQATFGSSTYHSLQLMARKNSKRGLNFIAAYTYSKLLTDSDAPLSYGGTQNVQDFTTPRVEKAIASFDYTHVLKLTWFYDLPFGRGRRWLNSGGAIDRFVGGWQITAIQNYTSGNPLSISSNGYSNFNSSWSIRGDVVPGVSPKVSNIGHLVLPQDQASYTQYLNPAAFTDPPLSPFGAALRYGNSPGFLSNVRGPMQMGGGEAFGVIKNTKLSERYGLEFRADMFNVFNRARLGDPDTCLCDGMPNIVNGQNQGGTFGMVLGPQNGPRIIQFALRLNF